MPHLVLPHTRYRTSFLTAMEEFAQERRAGDATMVGEDLETHGPTWHTDEGFAGYVTAVLAESERPRHELTDRLREVGGHIGYDVRRSRRREGHATAMQAAVLSVVAAMGIERALVTCDADNVGSRRVIEGNGGVPEDQRRTKLRFWITTLRA